ncbi:MAG: hypothetical protein JWQ09_3312 [Segetibacter sp.]|nr:hypothetical protein [Segetibacter sp.]
MYAIVVKKSALKELAQISPPYHKKIIEAIDLLANNPKPEGVKKLKGEEAQMMEDNEALMKFWSGTHKKDNNTDTEKNNNLFEVPNKNQQ